MSTGRFRNRSPLGGLYLNPSVTRKKFLRMLEILIRADCPYCVYLRGKGLPLTPTDLLLEEALGTISVTDERCIARVASRSSRTVSGRGQRFRDQVRQRDRKCVITGFVNHSAYLNEWTSFEAAHIFPLSHEDLFRSLDYPRFVTNRSDETETGINSCQNGILMLSTIHQQFDSFNFAIDADDNYKITCFRMDMFGVDGGTLDPVCRDPMDEKGVIDEFLRWHFRQTVLANMKGNGEPVFEFDFPDGSDMVGEILGGPRAAERMESELFSRLNPSVS
ncbi:HNH endonuclease-domain-containing protein [Lipomyces doorenjongii]|uniref:HNH endonuclease-domain-containing protein n=1 Tax=Lipomyces doorenjongii TaxID=383834 RepID=UPI0034CE601B